MRIPLLLFILCLASPSARAQSGGDVDTAGDARITLGMVIQARASYGLSSNPADDDTRLGFGLRRARFRVLAELESGAGLFMQLDAAGSGPSILDFFGQYRLAERWRFRFGRVASALPAGFIQTGIHYIDVADRAAIVERWGQMTIGGDGRDFGLESRFATGRTEAILFLHNGDGNWDRIRGNFRPSISGGTATDGVQRRGMAVTGLIRHQTGGGVDVGGFLGYNGRGGPSADGRNYTAYGAHVYWGTRPGSQPVRIKADFVAVRYDGSQSPVGLSLLAAVRPVPFLEFIGRAETFESDDVEAAYTTERYLTLATTFSPSARRGGAFHRERITLALQRLDYRHSDVSETLLFLQFQIGF